MQPRFVKWVLFLLLLAIVTTEGLRNPTSKKDEQNSTSFKTRGSSRFSSRKYGSSESISTTTPQNFESSATPKASRRVPSARSRGSFSRSGTQTTIATSTSTEQSSVKPQVEAAITRNSSKSKFNYQAKIPKHAPIRILPRKLVPKIKNAEKVENSSDTVDGEKQTVNDRKYLPEGLSDSAKTVNVEGDIEGIEAPTADETPRPSNRKPEHVTDEESNPKTEIDDLPVLNVTTENSRSSTDRKFPPILGRKPMHSYSPGSSRFLKEKVHNKTKIEFTTIGPKTTRPSLMQDSLDFRKKLSDSHLKHDITASGSESIRINIPLNFEDSRRLSVLSTDAPPVETIQRLPNSRSNKSRVRQSHVDRKIEVEVTTAATRGASRKSGSGRGLDSSTEATTASIARSRGRSHDNRRSNAISNDISSTTTQSDLRRRNSSAAKATPRRFTSGDSSSRITETRSQNSDNRKSNSSRGRYRVEPSTTSIPAPILPTMPASGAQEVTLANIGNITPTYEPEVTTTNAPRTTSTTITANFPTTSNIVPVLSSEVNRRDGIADEISLQINAGPRRRASKEDFFNYGLGFRGRRPNFPGIDEVPATITTSTTSTPTLAAPIAPDNIPRGNPGWTLRRRPGHWYEGPSSGPSADPAAASFPVEDNGGISSTTMATITSLTRGGGRRGNKMVPKTPAGGSKDEFKETDNYPPDFKAQIEQLQKAGPLPRTPLEAIKMSSADLFAARSRMKLENARKLVKPELVIDGTSPRQVIVEPNSKSLDDSDQRPGDSQVDEDQKVYKITRKTSLSTEKPGAGHKSSTKSDWKPSKLGKQVKEGQVRTSRYKNQYTPKSKLTTTSNSATVERSTIEENDVDHTTKSPRADRYQSLKHKFSSKPRGNKIRGPKPSNVEGEIHNENPQHHQQITSTKSPIIEKTRKMFAPRKTDKNYVEDVKAVALKLRKTLESMEKSQTHKPQRRSDSSEGSTTLLTTMRTVKSFSFSTRLVKDDGESATTTKMKAAEEGNSVRTSTSSSIATEVIMRNPAENEVSTPSYSDGARSTTVPATSYDAINEIENSSASSTTESTAKSTQSSDFSGALDWGIIGAASTESGIGQVDYRARAAALTSDLSGSPVFVVYPSATEKPLSVAITPKVYRYHATVKPNEAASAGGQQSAMQEPIVSVKVSSSGSGQQGSAGVDVSSSNAGNTNIFSPTKSAAILKDGNGTVLEQLRSTVAPLLGTLGAKSPVFAAAYRNTNSGNSLPRVTPSGAPPRFSARYRGAELFVRKPTPSTNSLSQSIDSAPQIDVSSPGEPKVLTFYQAVENVNITNEQTDVRQLWQLGRAAQVENTTAKDPYGTNSINSDLPQIIPVKITNAINDNSPIPTDNVTSTIPDTTDITEVAANLLTTEQPEQIVNNKEYQQVTTDSTTINFPEILDRWAAIDMTTERAMSTSTELITEVSVSISDSSDKNNIYTTNSLPSSFSTTLVQSEVPDTSTTLESVTRATELYTSTIPSTLPVLLYNSEITDNVMDNSTDNSVIDTTNYRIPKKLDGLSSEQSEVSNSLLDITLSTSNNKTATPTFWEILIGEEPMKSTELNILSQVKITTNSTMNNEQNTIISNLADNPESFVTFDTLTTNKSLTPTGTEPTIMLELLQINNSLTNVLLTTEKLESNLVNSSKSADMSDIVSTKEFSTTVESISSIDSFSMFELEASTTSLPTTEIMTSPDTFTTTKIIDEENQNVITTKIPETKDINDKNITEPTNTSNILDVEIQFYNSTNATVPAGTEILNSVEEFFNNTDIQSTFEKFLYLTVHTKETVKSNNSIDNNFISRLMKIVERLSINSTNATEPSHFLDEYSLSNELPHLLGAFLDNINKTQSVTNDSTVENNEISVVAQTTNLPFTTITNSINTDTDTEMNTSSFTTQFNNEILETTTYLPITTFPSYDNSINNVTNTYENAPNITRMSEIFAKIINAMFFSNISTESQIQDLDLLTSNSPELLPMVENVTKSSYMDDSTNLVSLPTSTESLTTINLTTVTPTMLTHFQESPPATAQRTAVTNIQPNQIFTTLKPTTNSQLSYASSSTTLNTNYQSTINPKSSTPAERTTIPENNLVNMVSSTFIPSTTSLPTTLAMNIPTTIQQSSATSSTVGRFGDTRLSPAPKFSSSSSTITPLRDYLIYGIYPNKTIVRKRPEDNLIDARNVDSPYVIFGLYPDGKLVRKFPNGTVIPDPPSNPVEVVFSLSTTTTTNRPRLPDNQAINKGINNQNVDFYNNHSPVADVNAQNAYYIPNEVDNALGFSGPTGFDLLIGSVDSDTKKMTGTVPNMNTTNSSQQNGEIVQDRTRNTASAGSENEGKRNSILIGQDKFVNYWNNGQPNNNPKVLGININSAAYAGKESPFFTPEFNPNFDILPNSETGSRVTVSPRFPWKDPLDQIFGITTELPAITASVASNTLDDSNGQGSGVSSRPLSKLVEAFNPISSTINSLINNPTKATTTASMPAAPTITTSPTTSTTTTTTTTTSTTKTTSMTQPSTTATSGPTSISANPITTNANAFGTTFDDLAFLNALLEKPNRNEGSTKTLTEVEQLLANKILALALGKSLTNGGPTRSPKAIQPSNASPNSFLNENDLKSTSASPVFTGPSASQPIIIDLLPAKTTTKRPSTAPTTAFTWKPIRTYPTVEYPASTPWPTAGTTSSTSTTTSTTTPSTTTSTSTTSTTTMSTTTSTTTTTTVRPTTRPPVIITARSITTKRPRPTTPPPPSGPFANLLQSIFGRNPFAPPTTPRPASRRPVSTARKVVPATPKLTTTTPTTTTTTVPPSASVAQMLSNHSPRSIQTPIDAVKTPIDLDAYLNGIGTSDKLLEVTPKAALAKPSTTTFTPEEDAKFLAALLDLARNTGEGGGTAPASAGSTPRPSLGADDEAFLRDILAGTAKIQPLATVGGSDKSDAALLAAFLKEQGIGPSTPANSLREQLQQATRGVTGVTTTTTTRRPTTTTTMAQPRPRASTYPPPLFSNFGLFSGSAGPGSGGFAGGGPPAGPEGNVRSQVVNAAIDMTRAFGQFLGAAITGAAKSFQSFVKNGTRWG